MTILLRQDKLCRAIYYLNHATLFRFVFLFFVMKCHDYFLMIEKYSIYFTNSQYNLLLKHSQCKNVITLVPSTYNLYETTRALKIINVEYKTSYYPNPFYITISVLSFIGSFMVRKSLYFDRSVHRVKISQKNQWYCKWEKWSY